MNNQLENTLVAMFQAEELEQRLENKWVMYCDPDGGVDSTTDKMPSRNCTTRQDF